MYGPLGLCTDVNYFTGLSAGLCSHPCVYWNIIYSQDSDSMEKAGIPRGA